MNTTSTQMSTTIDLVEATDPRTLTNVSLNIGNSTDRISDENDVLPNFNVMLLFILIHVIASLLSLFTFLYGLVTWIMIPKWRTFQNYVYVSLMFCYTVTIWLNYLKNMEKMIILVLTYYFANANSCWFFIASIKIYMDIVIVFRSAVTRKMLKSNVFAWGMPMPLAVVQIFEDSKQFRLKRFLFAVFMLVISFFLYLRVLFCLWKASAATQVRQKAQIATFTFVMSGAPVLVATLIALLPENESKLFLLSINTVPQVQMIVICCFFFMLRSNRAAWRERRVRNETVVLGTQPSKNFVTPASEQRPA